MRLLGPDALAVVRPTEVELLDFYILGIQLYVLLSSSHCFIPFLYLEFNDLGHKSWIS